MKKILIAIIIGAILRFSFINWDSYGAFHPDERNISWAVTRIHFFDQMNPKFFAYGGLPIYLYRALGEVTVKLTGNNTWLVDWGHIAVIGRTVSATLSTVSILLTFLVGSVYFSPIVGALAAALLSVSPWAIEQAHFSTTETMLVFFVLWITYLTHRLYTKPTKQRVALVGIVWGLSIAAKTTSALFGIIPVMALLLPFIEKHRRTDLPKTLFTNVGLLIILGTTAAATFFIFSPYTILDFKDFMDSMTYETGVALGRFSVPYTLQFWHTQPFIYQFVTTIWQSGAVVILGIIGILTLLIAAIKKRRLPIMIFVIFPVMYAAWIGTWYAKFARYNVPFLPFATIAAAWLCAQVKRKIRPLGIFLTVALLLSTTLWGLANFSIYLRPQTRIVASDWIYAHVPSSAKLYTEHWNDGLPLGREGEPVYNRELLTVYDEPDDGNKVAYYINKLVDGDYIILSTRRIWATMPRLKEKYPVTSVFYQKLLNGTLGYHEVARFSSYPQLFGYVINDDTAEESLQVFDHPTVRIFQNTEHFSREELLARL